MVDALVSIVFDQLASIAEQEVKLVLSVRKDVKALSSKIETVKAVIHDAEMKQIKDEAVKLWLEQLKDILYDADDVLDEWNTRINLSSLQIQGVDNDDGGVRFRKKVLSYFLCPCVSFKSVIVDYGFGTRIKKIREGFDKVIANKEFLMLNQGQSHEEPHQRLTSSIIGVAEILYGRDHDKNVIISKLLSESSHQDLNTHVISIVGTGGFGKTTLAKLVLKEQEVQKTFEKIMWVCVSDPFNLIEVTKAIIEQAIGSVPSHHTWEALHQCLCNSVKGSRYLLVLDDVWTENTNHWAPLKLSLDGGAQGSRVIVTTRDERVAQMMGSKHTHNLGRLSHDDSWLLFKHIAFCGGQEDAAKFENIGKEICKKCKGVPLAIKVVASLMCNKRVKKEWNSVLGSEIWDIPQIQKEYLPSLFLSYYPFSPGLKQCFMYCAVFPKDTVLKKDELVKLWMAQGFLGSGGNKELEKIGEESFDELAMRSFFQISERGREGNISSCMMHDLVHDFALFLAKKECCSLGYGNELDDSKVRHMGDNLLEDCSTIYKAKNLRSLWASSSINLITVFSELRFLRVLDLSRSRLEQLPDEVGRLLHLRYLDLSGARLLELPETISRLYNLQTLNLNWCINLIKLPDGIVELINLRHLQLEETSQLSCLPRGIGRLKFLRTLSKFIVGDASNGCNISELKHLCFLQGSLDIRKLGRVADANEAAHTEMKKKRLDLLSLNFNDSEEGDFDNMSGVLENLQPHEDVQELKIYGFAGFRLPSWFSNSSMLTNLAKLRLVNCEKTTELPALGNLASLEELELRNLRSVKHIGTKFCGFGVAAFPKLKKLVIFGMSELIEWEFPVSMAIMPCLSELQLSGFPMLRELPGLGGFESLERLHIGEISSVKHIGPQFYGFGVAAFPKLKALEISGMSELIEWELPVSTNARKIMPCLEELELSLCPKLRRLKSLDSLDICDLPSIKRVGPEFWGVSADEFSSSSIQERVNGGGGGGDGELIQEQGGVSCFGKLEISFPKLSKLTVSSLNEWEEWILPPFEEDREIIIMPCLREFETWRCPKLVGGLPDILAQFKSLEILKLKSLVKCEDWEDIRLPCLRELVVSDCDFLVIPAFLFSHTLRQLEIEYCTNLRGMQPCLPPLLESLNLRGDVGVLSESLPISGGEELSHNYLNLQSFVLYCSKHPSLPKGFNHLTAIQELSFDECESLDFDLNELKHLTMLQQLCIWQCPILAKRFQSSREDWLSILSHVPLIEIDNKNIRERD